MRILRAGDHRRVPWKNGRGQTAEIAVHPPGAPIDGFDVRVSMAAIVEDGAFSVFEGVDRTLIILEGEGVSLRVEGVDPVELRRTSPPHRFAGETPTEARLLHGPVTDLNVMTRRGRSVCRVRRQRGGMVEGGGQGQTLVFATGRRTETSFGALAFSDCVLLDPGERIVLGGADDAPVVVIDIVPVLGGPGAVQ